MDGQQRFQAETQRDLQMKAMDNEAATVQKNNELQLQAANDQRDAERELATATYEHERNMADIASKERMKAAEIEHDRWKTEYQAAVQIQTAQMSQQTAVHNAQVAADSKKEQSSAKP